MSVKELGHLVLYVRNLDRSASFYREVLGWHQIAGPGADVEVAMPFRAAAFSGGRTHHELLLIEVGEDAPGPPPGRRTGLYHFGLKVGDTDDDLRAALASVEAAGGRIVGTADHTVTHSVYIFDPDGNEIELYIDVEGVDWSDPKQLLAEIKPLAL
ncbi:MAG TPA: VOC family protein [Acidimicrobiales bacterium]|nr:VOC family protein [Acidimicrobiales bacterium]